MAVSGIQGLPLEVTVVGCYNLEDKEWISRQDPYVCLEYGSTKFRTKTCTDGGKNPTFQEKFTLSLIEGLRELNVIVWNSHTLSADEFIGNGRIQLHKALSHGYDDANWPIQSRSGRHSGDVRLILHYSTANQSKATLATLVPSYATPTAALSQILPYGSLQPAPPAAYPPITVQCIPYPCTSYPPNPAAYPPPPPPSTGMYPPSPYPPTPAGSYPPQAYPPAGYPPPPQALTYYPPGSSAGIYPPPPY